MARCLQIVDERVKVLVGKPAIALFPFKDARREPIPQLRGAGNPLAKLLRAQTRRCAVQRRARITGAGNGMALGALLVLKQHPATLEAPGIYVGFRGGDLSGGSFRRGRAQIVDRREGKRQQQRQRRCQ